MYKQKKARLSSSSTVSSSGSFQTEHNIRALEIQRYAHRANTVDDNFGLGSHFIERFLVHYISLDHSNVLKVKPCYHQMLCNIKYGHFDKSEHQ